MVESGVTCLIASLQTASFCASGAHVALLRCAPVLEPYCFHFALMHLTPLSKPQQ